MSSSQTGLYPTTKELISEDAFYGVLWLGVGLSATAFAFRVYIRVHYMRRIHSSDYLMLFALLLQIVFAGLGQAYLSDIYYMTHVQNGVAAPEADLLQRMSRALRGDGIMLLISLVGIWVIKMNFLLFFYRLGHHMTTYRVLWSLAVVVVIGCGAAAVGMLPYACQFGDIMYVITQCSSQASVGAIYTKYKVSVAVDCVTDAVIICFPVALLFQTRISLRQKIILSSIFCLVGFTIGVTVVRGSIFGGVYKDLDDTGDRQVLDTTWALFWFYIEFMVSFIVACLVSFRSLWAHKEAKAKAKARDEFDKQERIRERTPSDPSNKGSGLRAKLQRMHDTLLDTFNDDETLWEHDVLPNALPSGKLSADFTTYNPGLFEWNRESKANAQERHTTGDSDSVQSLEPVRLADNRV